jgi:hypothetical protein
MSCTSCLAPLRRCWTYGRRPLLTALEHGDWNSLEQCAQCGALWVSVPHEPYASFPFWTLWPGDVQAWQRLNAFDGALVIHEWHDACLRETWTCLPADEQAHVQVWRERTYRYHNAIDRGASLPPGRYVQASSDLQRYLSPGAGAA